MTMIIRRAVVAASLIVLTAAPAFSQTITPSTMKRQHDPIQVPGELLSGLAGSDLSSLRVFAYRDGGMKQIPFQFDERTEKLTFIFDLGEKKNPGDANHQLDSRDLLVFRVCDSGARVSKEGWPVAEGIEIELVDPVAGGRSYVYLLKFGSEVPALLEIDTISLEHWDPWQSPELPFIVRGISFRISGLVNKINNKYYKTAINKTFQVPESAGGNNQNLLDGQKMRASTELMFGKIRIERNERNMIGGIDALKQGAVRGYGRQWMTVALPMGIEGPRIYSDVFTYDRIIVSPMELNIPINPDAIITRAGVEFGYDLNEAAIGMRFYSPNCMEGVTIDGKMTDREKAIPDDWVPWYLLTGPQGSLLFRVEIQEDLMKQTVNKLTYIDDLEQAFPPEDIPGCIGYARTTMEIKSVKAGQYQFQIEWYFPPHLWTGNGYDQDALNQFLNIKDAPVVIKAGGKEATNRALSPPMLVPSRKLK